MTTQEVEVWQQDTDANGGHIGPRPENLWIVSFDDRTLSVHRTQKAAERTAGTVRRLLARGTHAMNLFDRLREAR